jgi:hypothetical protein
LRGDASGCPRMGVGLFWFAPKRRWVIEFWKIQFPVEKDSQKLIEVACFSAFSCKKTIKTC